MCVYVYTQLYESRGLVSGKARPTSPTSGGAGPSTGSGGQGNATGANKKRGRAAVETGAAKPANPDAMDVTSTGTGTAAAAGSSGAAAGAAGASAGAAAGTSAGAMKTKEE